MRRLKFHLLIFLPLFWGAFTYAQVIWQPATDPVYDYLERMAQKGFIEFDDLVRPMSRINLAQKLLALGQSRSRMTAVQQRELSFFLKDFRFETAYLLGWEKIPQETVLFKKDKAGRFRVFSYQDSLFRITFTPLIFRTAALKNNQFWEHHADGLALQGYLGRKIGFWFHFTNEGESGAQLDTSRQFTPDPGEIILKSKIKENRFSYDNIRAGISYNWQWGDLIIAKDQLLWGTGRSGRIVLSAKPPAFPFFQLDVKPAKWLNFHYVHGWLNSDVIDSNRTYSTGLKDNQRVVYREKYYAMHSVTFFPWRGIDFSVGESIVYADRLKFAYLQPIMFFRPADHYLSSKAGNNAGDNAQIFFSARLRNVLPGTFVYGTLLIDEINTNKIFSKEHRNQIAFQLGGSATDFPFDNLSLDLEYVRLNPFVYRHYIPTQTYENSGYVLGHWIGHNADLVYSAVRYQPLRGLRVKIWQHTIRKGENGTPSQQYTVPQPPFLFGRVTKQFQWGVKVEYQWLHELSGVVEYRHLRNSQDDGAWSKADQFYLTVRYGI